MEQRQNAPKSLDQSPAGAVGPVSTRCLRTNKSTMEICRSSTLSSRWCQIGRGRLANWIFGNGVCPKDLPDQILARFACKSRIVLVKKAAILGPQLLLGTASNRSSKGRGNRNALPNGPRRIRFALGRHTPTIANAPAWCTRPGRGRSAEFHFASRLTSPDLRLSGTCVGWSASE